ncbi:hypothetical protein ABN034_28915 [Actinopolymorpha sp. B11F2]|uniref:hypothetical protein n=1 Tax=Actinopolymorpha sp. B11F2 TaxID=3160862 RepID=UPI0032E4870F
MAGVTANFRWTYGVPAALLMEATAVAATRVREVNGFWMDDHFEPATTVNLGIAVALRGGGQVTPRSWRRTHWPLLS